MRKKEELSESIFSNKRFLKNVENFGSDLNQNLFFIFEYLGCYDI